MKEVKVDYFSDFGNDSLINSYLKNRRLSYSHPAEKDIEWFKWKFSWSPNGTAIMPVSISGDEVVGSNSYGLYPLIRNGVTIPSMMPYDTFVHSDFQGKGLFKKMILAGENAGKDTGVKILLAFP